MCIRDRNKIGRCVHTVRVTTLDDRTGTLLARLEALCPDGGYHIVEAAELSPAFSAEEAAEGIACLADSRRIDVRYAEEGTYCLRILPSGRAYVLHARDRERAERMRLRQSARIAFAGAFAGGFLAALLAAVIVLVMG